MIYEDNIFTKIVNKKINTEVLYETKYMLVIKDANPQAKFHALILPKNNYIDYVDFANKASQMEKNSLEECILFIIKNFNLTNCKLVTNYGQKAGQEIFHFHTHILSY
jgi:histidine triad (HIT) family protein